MKKSKSKFTRALAKVAIFFAWCIVAPMFIIGALISKIGDLLGALGELFMLSPHKAWHKVKVVFTTF